MTFADYNEELKNILLDTPFKWVHWGYNEDVNNGKIWPVEEYINGGTALDCYPCLVVTPPSGSNAVSSLASSGGIEQWNMTQFVFMPCSTDGGDGFTLNDMDTLKSLGGTVMTNLISNSINSTLLNFMYENYRWDIDSHAFVDNLCFMKQDYVLEVRSQGPNCT